MTRKEEARKATTTIEYRRRIECDIKPGLGNHRLGKLRPHHIQTHLDRLLKGTAERKSMSPGSVIKVRAILRAALSDAERQGLVSRNVARLVEPPTVRKHDPVVIDAERLHQFLAHVENTDWEALWVIAALHGMRRGELIALRWCDIDNTKNIIRVRQEIVKVKGEVPCDVCDLTHTALKIDTPKTKTSSRNYPLVTLVAEKLLGHQLRQLELKSLFGADYSDHDLVFARPDGTPMAPEFFSREFKRLIVESGAADDMNELPTLKSLRSSAVTLLVSLGMPIETVSKAVGHSNTAVTVDHYLGASAENSRAGFEAFAQLLSRGSDPQSDPEADNRTNQSPGNGGDI